MILKLKEITMKRLLILLVMLTALLQINSAMASEDISGTWQGALSPAPGSELIIQFVITKNDDGSYAVVLNSPDQGAIKDIKASSVVYDSGKLELDVVDLSGSYEGVLKDGKFEGNWKQEGTVIPLNMKPYEKPVLTKEDKAKLAGQWHGELKIPSGTHMLVFRFEMKDESDFKGFLDLPNTGGKDLSVTDVELDGDSVKFKIPNAGAEFKGKFSSTELTGEIKLNTQQFPVTLKKGEYKAPVHDLNLPEATREQLAGEWHGQLKMPNNILHVEYRFEKTEKGEFVGFYALTDQNVKGIPFTEGNIVDGKLVLKIKVANAEYKGQLEGNKLTGEWSQAGISSTPLSLKKGKYIPPVFNLDLPEKTRESLEGEWHGHLQTQTNLLHVVLRFETTEKGEFIGFYDIPDQKVKDIKIFEASLSDGKITLKIPNALFTGELDGNELKGEVEEQNRKRTPITLKKGKYTPPVYTLDLPEMIKKLLSGKWVGKVGNLAVVIRFETSNGNFLGFVDSPDTGAPTIPVTELEFTSDNLVLKAAHVGGEFKAKFANNEFAGEWIQNSRPSPMTIKKGEYVPQVHSLKLPKETMELLSGKWQGKLGNLTITMLFEKNKTGDFVGFIQIPQQRLFKLPITEADYSNGKLTLKEKIGIAEVKGELSENAYEAEWIQGGNSTPLTLKKE